MKVIGISSSGRIGSYSRKIVSDILEESGIDYEIVDLAKLNIKGCLGCLQCAGDNRCIQKDDFQELVDKVTSADALVFGGANYYNTLNSFGQAFWERTSALRHRGAFLWAGKLGIAVGCNGEQEDTPATTHIEQMMHSNKMAVIASISDSGHQQCYDCGYGHNCTAGNVYSHMGLTTAENAQKNRPEEYCREESQDRAKAMGKMLGAILESRK